MELSSKILSDIIAYSKYAKYIPELKRRESWEETVNRNMLMNMDKYPLLVDEISKAYQLIYSKKILPSMRSIQFGGSAISVNPARIFNCSAVAVDDYFVFAEIMFLLLSGCGVGISVQKHHIDKLPTIKKPTERKRRCLIQDSLEGWADAIKVLTKAYFFGLSDPDFDYSMIRAKGTLIKTGGGKAPGPQPLKDCIHNLRKILDSKGVGSKLTPLECHDMVCHIADAVLSGGVRRSACLSLFSLDDVEMLTCKSGNWHELNPQRARANNSALILRHRIKKKQFDELWERIKANKTGEPAFMFSNNSEYLCNPCGEISLRSCQFCNLCTINVSNLESKNDFFERIKAASLIATLQAGYTDFHYLRDEWRKNTEKDCLIGVSMSGIASGNVLEYDLKEAAELVISENRRVASLIGINPACRTTCIKPEGCQTKETLLITNNGILELSEIGNVDGIQWQEHNISVCTDLGQEFSGRFFVNGLAETKKITLNSGITLESTYNHKFRIFLNGEYQWKEAKDIKVGDIIPYKVGGYNGGNIQKLKCIEIVRSSHDYRSINIKQPEYIDEDLAWFLGLYWGDGSTHKKGIRISCDVRNQDDCVRAAEIIFKKFGLNYKKYDYLNKNKNDYRCQYYWNSSNLLKFMKENDLIKPKSKDLYIPKFIRMSPINIIQQFIEGYAAADGCDSGAYRSFCTVSKKMATQLVVVLRAIGNDCKMRTMPSTTTSYGKLDRYWIQIRKGKKSQWSKQLRQRQEIWAVLDDLGLKDFNYDTVISIQNSQNFTFDVEVPKSHSYLSNSYVSHNTSSLLMGTSSGIHAWHNDYYIRRIRVLKTESIYKYLLKVIPENIEDDYFKPHLQAIISLPIKAPKGAILRSESTLNLLERIKKFNEEWIKNGHIDGDNTNNVSATISIKNNEWDFVGDWMWKNKESYNGLTVFPADDSQYVQMPHEDCSKYVYDKMLEKLIDIDLTKITEEEDNTKLEQENACVGGKCSVE